jgi:two-component system sensor histidine kinase/response regulator
LEATALIRQREKESGAHIPIIAMTAHAMKGDRERCLDAGMDGYIAKPIRANQLYETVEQMAARPSDSFSVCKHGSEQELTLDRDQILQQMGGNMATLREVVALFQVEYPKLMKHMRTAIAQQRPSDLERAAHTLKGSLQLFGVKDIAALALRVETMGRDENLGDAQEACLALEGEIQRLVPVLNDLTKP